MKFSITRHGFLAILMFLSVINNSFPKDVSGVYIRLPLLDWDRYYSNLINVCGKKHPDSINGLKDRINKWHSKNDDTVNQIISFYHRHPDALGKESIKRNRDKINDWFFKEMNNQTDEKMKEYCYYTPFNRNEYAHLLKSLKQMYKE